MPAKYHMVHMEGDEDANVPMYQNNRDEDQTIPWQDPKTGKRIYLTLTPGSALFVRGSVYFDVDKPQVQPRDAQADDVIAWAQNLIAPRG